MPAAGVFIIGSYEYRTAGARKGYAREIAKSLQLFAFGQRTDGGHGPVPEGSFSLGYHLLSPLWALEHRCLHHRLCALVPGWSVGRRDPGLLPESTEDSRAASGRIDNFQPGFAHCAVDDARWRIDRTTRRTDIPPNSLGGVHVDRVVGGEVDFLRRMTFRWNRICCAEEVRLLTSGVTRDHALRIFKQLFIV